MNRKNDPLCKTLLELSTQVFSLEFLCDSSVGLKRDKVSIKFGFFSGLFLSPCVSE